MKEKILNEEPNPKQAGKWNYTLTEFSMMILLGIIGVLSWIIMFSFGLLINSEVYRLSVLKQFDWYTFIMSILTYTPTNIALLCVIASFSGGCASRLLIARIETKSGTDNLNQEEEKTDSQLYMTENPFSSMLRGLVVYFAFLAGVFVANSNPFADPTPQQFAQSAGIVSLFSFVVGFDPTVFRSFLSISGKIKQNQK
jgi:hypothetical protein